MNDLFLGVDGGQSSTTAVIGDAKGNIVGWGSAGASNHVAAAEARAKFVHRHARMPVPGRRQGRDSTGGSRAGISKRPASA